MRSAIFQIKTDLLIIYQNINSFTQETLHPFFISKKIGTVHRKHFPKYSFLPYLTENEVFNISNKYRLPNKSAKKMILHKTLYTPPSFKKKFALSIAKAFRNVDFLPFFLVFTVDEVCNISNKYGPSRYFSKISKEPLQPFFILKKFVALHPKRFSKDQLLITFLLFLTVSYM